MVKLDVNRPFNEVIPVPTAKKLNKEEIVVEEDSKFFEKYINQSASQPAATANNGPNQFSESQTEKPIEKKQAEVTDFFKNLLQGGSKRETIGRTHEQTQKLLNAERELMKHTTQVIEKKNSEE